MPADQSISFSIEHLDPLGQGVNKRDGSITFIPKVLPGETGVARVRKSRKGVQFAQLTSLEKRADNRTEPGCEHFDDCPACHYLHTDYRSELDYKKDALVRALSRLPFNTGQLEVVAAPQRDGYRNRIQLHYRGNRIGMIDGLNDDVVEIPHCRIIRDELRPALAALYDPEATTNPRGTGHCELYFRDGQASVVWDKPYSHGGFTQVNDAMNALLKSRVTSTLTGISPKSLLDLFCGDGNLSNDITQQLGCKRVMIDGAASSRHADFVQLDLLKSNALSKFRRDHQRNSFDAILLDPPRSGFKSLKAWLDAYSPKHVIYVSCAPATLARDLDSVRDIYAVENVTLLDMFPGTRHFETLVHLRAN